MSFRFPASIRFDGNPWRLIYAPGDENTIMPNLDGSQVVSVTCDPVRVSGRDKPIYMAVFDVVFPPTRTPSGALMGSRRMKGFRTFSEPPLNPQGIKPWECAFYLLEQTSASESDTQRFFDAIIGQADIEQTQRAKADVSWCDSLARIKQGALGEQAESAERADGAEREVSDRHLSDGQ